MALKGQAKTDYQRDYMRKRRSNTYEPLDPRPVVLDPKEKRLAEARAVLEMALQPKTDVLKSTTNPLKEESNSIPWYNPSVHVPGDRVRVRQGKGFTEVVIPQLDAGGQPVPEYD